MGKANFTDEFKLDAIKQITERGSSVADVSSRLRACAHSFSSWIKRYNTPEKAATPDDRSSEIRRLKQELVRVTEERDILKKPPRTCAGHAKLSTRLSTRIVFYSMCVRCAACFVFTQEDFMNG